MTQSVAGWARERLTGNQTGEEGLLLEVLVVLLEVLLGGLDHLDTGELEAAVLEAGDDGTDEATLLSMLVVCFAFWKALPAIISGCNSNWITSGRSAREQL